MSTWHVATTKQNCYYYIAHMFRDCRSDAQANTTVGTERYLAAFSLSYQPLLDIGNYNPGVVQASAAAGDDFGATGPAAVVQFQIA